MSPLEIYKLDMQVAIVLLFVHGNLTRDRTYGLMKHIHGLEEIPVLDRNMTWYEYLKELEEG